MRKEQVMSIFDKWDSTIDTENLAKDIKKAEQNKTDSDYEEVPTGKYEVKIEKMELKESRKGDPMFSAWFRILSGDYKNQLLFMNAVITQDYQIKRLNDFFRSLKVFHPDEIVFESYKQYNDLIMDLMEVIEGSGFEFLINYKQSKSGFPIYTVEEVFKK